MYQMYNPWTFGNNSGGIHGGFGSNPVMSANPIVASPQMGGQQYATSPGGPLPGGALSANPVVSGHGFGQQGFGQTVTPGGSAGTGQQGTPNQGMSYQQLQQWMTQNGVDPISLGMSNYVPGGYNPGPNAYQQQQFNYLSQFGPNVLGSNQSQQAENAWVAANKDKLQAPTQMMDTSQLADWYNKTMQTNPTEAIEVLHGGLPQIALPSGLNSNGAANWSIANWDLIKNSPAAQVAAMNYGLGGDPSKLSLNAQMANYLQQHSTFSASGTDQDYGGSQPQSGVPTRTLVQSFNDMNDPQYKAMAQANQDQMMYGVQQNLAGQIAYNKANGLPVGDLQSKLDGLLNDPTQQAMGQRAIAANPQLANFQQAPSAPPQQQQYSGPGSMGAWQNQYKAWANANNYTPPGGWTGTWGQQQPSGGQQMTPGGGSTGGPLVGGQYPPNPGGTAANHGQHGQPSPNMFNSGFTPFSGYQQQGQQMQTPQWAQPQQQPQWQGYGQQTAQQQGYDWTQGQQGYGATDGSQAGFGQAIGQQQQAAGFGSGTGGGWGGF